MKKRDNLDKILRNQRGSRMTCSPPPSLPLPKVRREDRSVKRERKELMSCCDETAQLSPARLKNHTRKEKENSNLATDEKEETRCMRESPIDLSVFRSRTG